MNDLTIRTEQLPDTIEAVADFVVVNEEKLNAVKAAIRLARKAKDINLAELEKQQRELEITTVLAQCRLGELTAKIETKSGTRTDITSSNTRTKLEQLQVLGVSKQRASEYEKMSAHPEIVARIIDSGEHVTKAAILNRIKAEERDTKAAEKKKRKEFVPDEQKPMCELYVADIMDGLPMVTDNSVDFIITDPPYPKEYLPLYTALSKLAARVLKPGGSLLAMSGQSYLPEVISRLSENMDYHWCLAYETPGGQSPQLFQKKVNTFWKPVLWFTKGKYEKDWVGDTLKSSTNDNDKRFHEWGQSFSGISDLVNRFCYPGDLVLDPFLGGGTTGVASVLKGCKFIGSDIDGKNIAISKQRITEEYAHARR